jgi:hypothetical protein
MFFLYAEIRQFLMSEDLAMTTDFCIFIMNRFDLRPSNQLSFHLSAGDLSHFEIHFHHLFRLKI